MPEPGVLYSQQEVGQQINRQISKQENRLPLSTKENMKPVVWQRVTGECHSRGTIREGLPEEATMRQDLIDRKELAVGKYEEQPFRWWA